MYSIFFSKFDLSISLVEERLKKLVKEDMKVAIIPWAFPNELDSERLINDYFKKNERRYNKYVPSLLKLGIKEENIQILDCYGMPSNKIKNIINNSNILLLPGGNPEMFYKKVVEDVKCLDELKKFKGIIIGESAGTILQLKKYFITAKNNYYKRFAFYEGFGILDVPFYLDVHSSNNRLYKNKLKKVAQECKKEIYALFDDGAIIYNRKTKKLEMYGRVSKIGF